MPFANQESVHIVVASQNPVKSDAILRAFRQLFPDTDVKLTRLAVDSGVADQPMTDAETRRGALNRLQAAQLACANADLWAGIEGGIDRDGDRVDAFAWIVVATMSFQSAARTATFPLPPPVVRLIDKGVELGHANDRVLGVSNSKHHGGAVGSLTHGAIDRTTLYEHAAILALAPFRSPGLYSAGEVESL